MVAAKFPLGCLPGLSPPLAPGRGAVTRRLDLGAGTLTIELTRVVVDGKVIESDGKAENSQHEIVLDPITMAASKAHAEALDRNAPRSARATPTAGCHGVHPAPSQSYEALETRPELLDRRQFVAGTLKRHRHVGLPGPRRLRIEDDTCQDNNSCHSCRLTPSSNQVHRHARPCRDEGLRRDSPPLRSFRGRARALHFEWRLCFWTAACPGGQGLRREIWSDSAMLSASTARSPSPKRSRAWRRSLSELVEECCAAARSGSASCSSMRCA
jgi:hypothetical protein